MKLYCGVERPKRDYTTDGEGVPIFNYDYQGDNSVLQPRGLKYCRVSWPIMQLEPV